MGPKFIYFDTANSEGHILKIQSKLPLLGTAVFNISESHPVDPENIQYDKYQPSVKPLFR